MTYPAPPSGPGMPPTAWPPPVPPPPPRPWPGLRPDGSTRGPRLLWGWAVLGIGVVVTVAAIVGIVNRAGDFTDTSVFKVPGEVTVDLEEGDWRLYVEDDAGSVVVEQVEVQGPAPVRLRIVDSTDQFRETLNVGEDHYTEVAAFDVDESGDYTFVVSDDATDDSELAVARSTLSLFGSAVAIGGWVLVLGIAGVILLIGAILLVFSLVNRSKANRSRAQIAAGGG